MLHYGLMVWTYPCYPQELCKVCYQIIYWHIDFSDMPSICLLVNKNILYKATCSNLATVTIVQSYSCDIYLGPQAFKMMRLLALNLLKAMKIVEFWKQTLDAVCLRRAWVQCGVRSLHFPNWAELKFQDVARAPRHAKSGQPSVNILTEAIHLTSQGKSTVLPLGYYCALVRERNKQAHIYVWRNMYLVTSAI